MKTILTGCHNTLKRIRKEQYYSIKKWAKALELNAAAIGRYEAGKVGIPESYIVAVANFIGRKPRSLFIECIEEKFR